MLKHVTLNWNLKKIDKYMSLSLICIYEEEILWSVFSVDLWEILYLCKLYILNIFLCRDVLNIYVYFINAEIFFCTCILYCLINKNKLWIYYYLRKRTKFSTFIWKDERLVSFFLSFSFSFDISANFNLSFSVLSFGPKCSSFSYYFWPC